MPLGMTRPVAQANWVLKYVNYFEYMAQISHDRFMEINNEVGVLAFLIEAYELGHTVSASMVLEWLYEYLDSYQDLAPFDMSRFEDLDAW